MNTWVVAFLSTWMILYNTNRTICKTSSLTPNDQWFHPSFSQQSWHSFADWRNIYEISSGEISILGKCMHTYLYNIYIISCRSSLFQLYSLIPSLIIRLVSCFRLSSLDFDLFSLHFISFQSQLSYTLNLRFMQWICFTKIRISFSISTIWSLFIIYCMYEERHERNFNKLIIFQIRVKCSQSQKYSIVY